MIARLLLTAAVFAVSVTAADAAETKCSKISPAAQIDLQAMITAPTLPPIVIGPYTPPIWVGPCPELGECPTPWGKETEPAAVASAEPGYWIMESALPFSGLAPRPARKIITIDPAWLIETDSAWIEEIEAQLN
jgi:hypothetical protein